jgi:hypothetical protein
MVGASAPKADGMSVRDALAGATAGAATGRGPESAAAGAAGAVADGAAAVGVIVLVLGGIGVRGSSVPPGGKWLRCLLGPMVEPGVVVVASGTVAVGAVAVVAAG